MRLSKTLSLILLLLCVGVRGGAGERSPDTIPFRFTGYYTTFMRMQSMGLREWKQVVDCMREDGGNTLLLWMGGAFRSRKFPITWKYNQDHKNVQKDFVRALIDYAHTKQIRVLVCLTPLY